MPSYVVDQVPSPALCRSESTAWDTSAGAAAISPAPQPLQRRPARKTAGMPIPADFKVSTSLAQTVLIIQGLSLSQDRLVANDVDLRTRGPFVVTGPDNPSPRSVYWTTTRRSPMPRSTPILGVLLLASLLANVLL